MIDVFYDDKSNSYTEGFEVKQDGLDITIGKGSLKYISDEPVSEPLYDLEGHKTGLEQSDEKRIESIDFPEITFTVQPHEEMTVQYDVYLLEIEGVPSYHLDRTLLSGVVQADYTGDGKPLHKLLTMVVPASANSLDHVPVHVNLLKIEDPENPPL